MPVRALLEAEDARLDVWRVWVDGCCRDVGEVVHGSSGCCFPDWIAFDVFLFPPGQYGYAGF